MGPEARLVFVPGTHPAASGTLWGRSRGAVLTEPLGFKVAFSQLPEIIKLTHTKLGDVSSLPPSHIYLRSLGRLIPNQWNRSIILLPKSGDERPTRPWGQNSLRFIPDCSRSYLQPRLQHCQSSCLVTFSTIKVSIILATLEQI